MSDDAKFMLKEYYISIAKEYGSPRVRETIIATAKMIAQLKLKNVVDTEDAKETMEFYNVILQQLSKVVNVTTNPSDETFGCCISILRESPFAIQLEELIKSACSKNGRVRYYIGERFKLRDNIKLRPIVERLRSHSHIVTVSEKPLVFRWTEEKKGSMLDGGEGGGGGVGSPLCDICDACDTKLLGNEKNSEASVPDKGNKKEGDIKKDPEFRVSHISHASDRTVSTPVTAAEATTTNPVNSKWSDNIHKREQDAVLLSPVKPVMIDGVDPIVCIFCGFRTCVEFDLRQHLRENHWMDLVKLPIGRGSIPFRIAYAIDKGRPEAPTLIYRQPKVCEAKATMFDSLDSELRLAESCWKEMELEKRDRQQQ